MDQARAILYGDYYLTRKIATGGMAELFRALKVGAAGFEKLLVVKRLLPHLAADRELREMFLDEARLASQLNHANIAQVYDLGQAEAADPGRPQTEITYFIAMEYVFGKSLAEVIRRGQEMGRPLSVQNAVRIVSNAAAALDYAHEKAGPSGQPLGLVHRDVSPQNILISYEGEVKLVDFGIAKALSSSTTTRPGTLKGKFSYMAPEQAKGEPVDRRTDVYALGIVMWESLTGKRLFAGDSEAVILGKVIAPVVPPPSGENPDVPPELEEVCLKALAPDPDERFASAAEMCSALEAWLHTLPNYPSSYSLRGHMLELFGGSKDEESQQIGEEQTAVRRECETGGEKPQAPPPPAEATQVYTPEQAKAAGAASKPKGGGKGGIIAVAAALVIAAGVAGYFLLSGPKPAAPPPPAPAGKEQAATKAPAPAKPQAKPKAEPQAKAPAPATEPAPAAKPKPAPLPAAAQKGQEALKAHRYGEALAALDQAVEADSALAPRLARDRAEALLGLASEKAQDRPKEALADLERATELDPSWGEAFLQLGRVRTKLHMYEPALEAYQKAIDLGPRWRAIGYFNRGYILLEQEKYQEAAEAYGQVVKIDSPHAADAWVNLAVCHYKLGDMDAAEHDLRQALAENPNHERAQKYLKLLLKRKAGKASGHREGAKQ